VTLPLSVLDLVPVGVGTGAAASLRRTLDLARLAERLGYVRYWFAEHHGMPSVASSSPEVLIAHVAASTTRLNVGSGGVMLPNHAPLRVAEAFRTLAALHPGRIDLGIGRAPGSDASASRALRAFDGEHFPRLLSELLAWSEEPGPQDGSYPARSLRAVPDDAPLPPIWLLGSSGASARMAGAAGMGYSFASHFSAAPAAPAFAAYRQAFVASAQFPAPHAILGVAAVCAPTADEAEWLAGAMDLAWARLRSGIYAPLPTPEEAQAHRYTEVERQLVSNFRQLVIVGTPASVRAEIEGRAHDAQASEVMIVCNIHGHEARLRSYRLIAEAFGAVPGGSAA